MEFSDRLPVVHCVEGGDFVDAHGWHLEEAPYLVHNTDGGVAELALAEIEEGHYGCFFVLGGVTFEDLGYEKFILRCEFKGDREVVFRCIAVLGTAR
jgi:hypothetical protein